MLLLVVLLPTVSLLWFMSQAMSNEGLAVRQKLSDVYRSQLLGIQQQLQRDWQARSMALGEEDPDLPASMAFAARVRAKLAESVVVFDASGRPAYPAPPRLSAGDFHRPEGTWRRAETLERAGQQEAAAVLFGTIAAQTTDSNRAARALQAQARCLSQAEKKQDALAILSEELSRPKYRAAVDSQGRLIAPSAQLRALELLGNTEDPAFQGLVQALGERLRDYGEPELPAAQRRFLMTRLWEDFGSRVPAIAAFETLPAERLAERYLASDPPAPPTTSLQPSGLPGIWHLASPGGSVVALYDQTRLEQDFASLLVDARLPGNTEVELLPPGVEPEGAFVVSLPAGGFLQDWRLALRPEDQALFATAAGQRITAYRLIGGLIVVVILILTLFVVRAFERQLRLTRLKNDLLSTVSHELKTPLASMRLLVDTLLETGIDDPRRVQEYLQLIAKENVRLSRLVDNFLTFSRMEKGRQSFDKKPLRAEAVAEAAAASVSDRFRTGGCRFEVLTEPDLPELLADHDALVTVLLNLLDNAYKYSQGERQIVLRTYGEKGFVCFAVRDNGVGLSGRVMGKIFDRFYQVDQSLSRAESGTGLGLSIVKFIVSAHGGTVSVDSRLEEGSTFTVRLPVESDELPSRGSRTLEEKP